MFGAGTPIGSDDVYAPPRAIVAPSGAGAASETWNKPMVGAMQLG